MNLYKFSMFIKEGNKENPEGHIINRLIRADDIDHAKAVADEMIYEIPLSDMIEKAEIYRYYKTYDIWKLAYIYDCKNKLKDKRTLKKYEKNAKIHFWMDKKIVNRLRNIAKKQDVHTYDIIRKLITDFVEEQEEIS